MIAGLRQLVGASHGHARATGALLMVISNALGRRGARFAALVARFRAGLLRASTPRGTVARRAAAATPATVTRDGPTMPRGTAWLLRMMQGFWLPRVGGVGFFTDQLSRLLAEPEMAAVIAASPEAGRILRPLWRMLSFDPMPALLRPTPRARAAPGEVPTVCAAPEAPEGDDMRAAARTIVPPVPRRAGRGRLKPRGFRLPTAAAFLPA